MVYEALFFGKGNLNLPKVISLIHSSNVMYFAFVFELITFTDSSLQLLNKLKY